jgi:hypothetical protein
VIVEVRLRQGIVAISCTDCNATNIELHHDRARRFDPAPADLDAWRRRTQIMRPWARFQKTRMRAFSKRTHEHSGRPEWSAGVCGNGGANFRFRMSGS